MFFWYNFIYTFFCSKIFLKPIIIINIGKKWHTQEKRGKIINHVIIIVIMIINRIIITQLLKKSLRREMLTALRIFFLFQIYIF